MSDQLKNLIKSPAYMAMFKEFYFKMFPEEKSNGILFSDDDWEKIADMAKNIAPAVFDTEKLAFIEKCDPGTKEEKAVTEKLAAFKIEETGDKRVSLTLENGGKLDVRFVTKEEEEKRNTAKK